MKNSVRERESADAVDYHNRATKGAAACRYSTSFLGFLPFFLLAGISAVLLMGFWLAVVYALGLDADTYHGPVVWPGHEMVFGYAVAVIAGFLLTAVRNWTGVPTARGPFLFALAGLWIAGRLVPFAAAQVPASSRSWIWRFFLL